MRLARWRGVLVPMIVLVAGCLPAATPALPTSFTDRVWTFTAASPAAGTLSAAQVVAALRTQSLQLPNNDYLASRAVPTFGLLSCPAEVRECQALRIPEQPQPVWLVLYPDTAPDSPDGMGWAMVDAVTGLDGMYMTHDP